MDSNSIRIVVYRDGQAWVAQCLEHDIGAQAESPSDLRNRLDEVLWLEATVSRERMGKAFEGISPAPDHFFKMWDDCETAPSVWDSPTGLEHAKLEMALCA